jgi:hypothetical protein
VHTGADKILAAVWLILEFRSLQFSGRFSF